MSNSNRTNSPGGNRNNPAPPSEQHRPPMAPQTPTAPAASSRPSFPGAATFGPQSGNASPSRSPIGNLLPAVTAPKGGGALRGIGEKLELNPVTGTAGLTIPLASVPGRAGALELSLSYDSGAGNGPFGLGWQLSPPSISRKTDRGLPRYGDGDTFVLSGAEDLIPDPNGSQTVSTPSGDEQHLSYRPRVEGSYARITRRTIVASGEVYWTVQDGSNVISTFGRSTEARIVDPKDSRRIFAWLLETVEDDRGNITRYEYKPEDLDNVNLATLGESHRRPSASPGAPSEADFGAAQKYLKRIYHTNTTPFIGSTHRGSAPLTGSARDHYCFEVVFDYEDHPTANPQPEPSQTWSCRLDAFSSYRAGFERRSYRRCKRVLVFHRFADLNAGASTLTASTTLTYDENAAVSTLTSVEHAGYDDSGQAETMPELTLSYQSAELDKTITTLTSEGLAGLSGVDGQRARWVDLDGEGIPGILSPQAGGWVYRRNLGEGQFAPPQPVPAMPGVPDLAAGAQLLDLGGDSRLDLVQLAPPLAGAVERKDDGSWGGFRPFASRPNINPSDPSLQLIDLTGDGLADMLLSDAGGYLWYEGLGKKGFGPGGRGRLARDEREGPYTLYSDHRQAIHFADMSGDGMPDIVRIEAARVCYWPNLGYGRFGRKVTMSLGAGNRIAGRDFDPARLRLGDVDGSGPTDILYLEARGVAMYKNQAGNSFAPVERVEHLPLPTDHASVALVDVYGQGTACLVWSSPLRMAAHAPLRVVDLLGGQKPHVLATTQNGLGGETRLSYTTSTKHYLQDRKDGKAWISTLPFVVHVVNKVETIDHVSGTKLVQTYRYRHGAFDPVEREFRGFAYSEQADAETLGIDPSAPQSAEERPPVVSKTWVHTGLYHGAEALEKALAAEYFALGDGLLLPDTVVDDDVGGTMTAQERRQAARALRGRTLRQEVYAQDGSAEEGVPYTVTETSYRARRKQAAYQDARGRTFPAIFDVTPDQTLTAHLERDAADPRLAHSLALEVDAYGVTTLAAEVVYPRVTPHVDVPEQGDGVITIQQATVIHDDARTDGGYRLAVPTASELYELTGVTMPTAGTLLTPSDLTTAWAASTLLSYEQSPNGTEQRRLLQAGRTRYLDAALSTELPQGQVGPLALPARSYTLAYTPGQLSAVYGTDVTAQDLTNAGYVDLDSDGCQWARSGTATYDATKYYQVVSAEDPFGKVYTVTYDSVCLTVVASSDPLGNTQQVQLDYRTLVPAMITDENDNRTAFATDGLGRLIAMAEMGKVGAGEGDDLSSLPDSATATFSYDLFRWQGEEPTPAVSIARARETHGDPQTRWLEQRRYTDGLGREIMTKVQAEPGDAPQRDAQGELVYDSQTGELVYAHTETRWVGTGRTVFDNKGEPVKQYEPFFSATGDYEPEIDVAASGVTPVIYRDPLGRVVRVEQPDGTETKVEFDAWQQTSYDAGDLVMGSDWHTAALAGSSEQVRAAQLSEDYAATPSVVHLDALGREVLAQEDGGGSIGVLSTTLAYDIEGQLLTVTDPRGLVAQSNTYDVAGRLIQQVSNDAGTEKVFVDAMSQPVLSWTARGLRVRQTRDDLQREVATYVDDGNSEILTERMVYGEVHGQATTLNLNGKPYMTFDGAGQVVIDSYDFKDQPVSTTRRYAVEFAPSRQELNWSAVDGLDDLADVADAVSGILEEASYTTSLTVDALDRVITQTTPDGAVTTTTYDEGGLLESIVVDAADGQTHTVLADIDENARGQRVREVLGEEAVVRSYEYDPQTFRLTRLLSERSGDSAVLQDLRYTYDVVGNIVEVQDEAEQDLYFQTSVVSGDRQYVYDPLYRLTWASGREHPGQQPTANSSPMFGQVPHPNDPTALSRYTETYSYDNNGNLTQMAHSGSVSWTRNYVIDTATNRLVSHNRPSAPDPYTYSYDAAGNMLGMAHVSSMSYTSGEQMVEADLGGGGTAYYGYAGGERARKVIDHDGWTERRLYLGGWERYVRDNGSLGVERETLHVYEGERRIALIETKVSEGGTPVQSPVSRVRVQLDDHLGSAGVEVELSGAVIGYEEYFAYGATSFRMSSSEAEVSTRRYRYIGKERDEETGLSYHSARYYAAWLGRWTTSDPAGLVDGPGTYSYCRGDPVGHVDVDGMRSGSRIARGALHYAASKGSSSAKEALKGLKTTRKAISRSFPTRAQGALGVGGSVGLAAAGVALCSSIVGCIVGGVLLYAAADNGAASVKQMVTARRERTNTGRVLGEKAERFQRNLEYAAPMMYMGSRLFFEKALPAAAKTFLKRGRPSQQGSGRPAEAHPDSTDPKALPSGPTATKALPAGPPALKALPAGPPAPKALPVGPPARKALPSGPAARKALPEALPEAQPLLPDDYWINRQAPLQVTPGTRTQTISKPSSAAGNPLYRSTTHYDQFGRQIGQTHYSTHGRPSCHANPHHHRRNPATGQRLRHPGSRTRTWPGLFGN
jgi:RHS repeat-associated protein